MGVDLAHYKTRAFALSAAYAGIGGRAVHVRRSASSRPESFTLTLSFAFLAAIVVGGLATVAGAVFGALFIVFVPSLRGRRRRGAGRRDLRRRADRAACTSLRGGVDGLSDCARVRRDKVEPKGRSEDARSAEAAVGW